ncbi:transmembrane protein 135-like isoform X1 [Scylla paramamosain]|uniref:transmembrane protein 135-like n=1 Tax=Scylla paramamosain TaxID=85552 RepID=UPI0030831ECD
MGSFSKILPYSCYELGHCWKHSCSSASFEICIIGFIESIKIYGVVYLLTGLVNARKISMKYGKKALEELLNISLFPDSQCFWVHWLLLCCQVITGIKCSISMAHQTLPLTLVVLTCLVNTCPPVFLPLIALQVTSECG